MKRIGLGAICLVAAALSAGGAGAEGERRYTTDEEAALFAGVGVVSLAGGGGCSGALIRPDVVLTAAHCVADADARTISRASEVTFTAGVRRGKGVDAVRARRIEPHPSYFTASPRYDRKRIRVDLAKIHLERPVRGAPSYRVDYTPPAGANLAMLSYSRGRWRALSAQTPCPIIGRETEFLLMGCVSDPGASGAPYFLVRSDGEARIVAVNSGVRGFGAGRRAMALAFDHVRSFIGSTQSTRVDAGKAETGLRSAPEPRGGTLLPGGSRPGDRRLSSP